MRGLRVKTSAQSFENYDHQTTVSNALPLAQRGKGITRQSKHSRSGWRNQHTYEREHQLGSRVNK